MELIDRIGQILATLCCSIFAGASLYINLVEHPARMECGTELAATEFAPSYRRAAIMQASLAILGFLASMLVWLRGNDVWWLVGGLLLVLVVPFTLIVIVPTNRKLLDPSLDKGSDEAACRANLPERSCSLDLPLHHDGPSSPAPSPMSFNP